MRTFSKLFVATLILAVQAQSPPDAPDPGKEEGFKDLITENNLDEK
jgi:hypothetical protein